MQLERLDLGKATPESTFDKNVEKSFLRLMDVLTVLLNGGLKFSDNFEVYTTTITTNVTPGVETAITHTLKRVPVGYIVAEQDKAGSIYLGTTAKSATNYYVASDVASVTATLLIF